MLSADATVVTQSQKETPATITKTVVDKSANASRETPSIFNRKKIQIEAEEQEASSVIDKKKEPFSEEGLLTVWKGFGSTRPDPDKTEKLILSRDVKKGEGYEILVFLSSELEGSFLEKFETELIQYLRTNLQNDYITINKQIAQVEETRKLYTTKDIYEYMVQQNPKLQDLKDKLGLDFDY